MCLSMKKISNFFGAVFAVIALVAYVSLVAFAVALYWAFIALLAVVVLAAETYARIRDWRITWRMAL